MADIALRVEIDLDLLEAELVEEGLDHLGAATVFRHGDHDELVRHVHLQLLQGRHFLQARTAPGRP